MRCWIEPPCSSSIRSSLSTWRCSLVAPPAVAKRALLLAAQRSGARHLDEKHQQALLALARQPARGTVTLDLPGVVAVREYNELRFSAPDAPSRAQVGAPLSVTGSCGPYLVRAWQPGDRIRLARLKGKSRKLSDLFIDAKVPLHLRGIARVVVRAQDEEIVWVEHLGVAYTAKVGVSLTRQDGVVTNKLDRYLP